jgi:iron complex transport system permease protein
LEGEKVKSQTTYQNWFIVHLGRFSFKLDRRVLPVSVFMLALAVVILVLSVSYGEYDISPFQVVRTIFGQETNADFQLVVWQFRLPRILVAFFVGAALALSGAILQGITRNPLADPGILGVVSGASLAAVAAIIWLRLPASTLPLVTFFGGAGTAALIYLLAWKDGSQSIRMILIGIGLAAIATALTNILLVFGEIYQVQQAYIWLAGSVYGRDWGHVSTMTVGLIALVPLTFLQARHLNALNLGDDTAKALGAHVEAKRGLLLLLSVLLASLAVSVAGTVGFVGLVAPHIARRLVGPAHEGLLAISAMIGGLLLMLADLLGRAVIAPSELPVGIMTALIGAPYFMFLLYRHRNP